MTDWTLGKKLAFGFSLAGVTIVLLAFFGYQSAHHLIENDRWVSHTQEVRHQIAALLAGVADMEAGMNGYVITGDAALLEPYQVEADQVEKTFEELERQTVDNPVQQRRLQSARPLLATRLSQLKQAIDQRRAAGFEMASKALATGEGLRQMQRLHQVMRDMDNEERTLLDRRRDEAEASAEATKTILLFGSLVGILLVVAVGTFLTRSLSQQIGSAAQHMQSSSAELQTASSQQATSAKQQATAMAEITTTITELLATSRQITEGAQRVAAIAEQTAALAKSGDATVEKGHESIGAIRRQVDLIVSHMLDLGKKSQQIGTVVDVVGELAEQTNILAINATIEAAGAGDAGKRFGVVADEIRKLADRVASSTKEVRGLIDDVRSAVNTTIMTTETGSKSVESGSKQFLDVASSFKQIVSQVVVTTEASREIGLSTKQQATAVEQVNVAVTSVAQATRETEVSTSQTLQTASQLATLSRNLLRMIQSSAAGATRLRSGA